MIKENVLREFRPQVRYQDGQGITLSSVQEAINDYAMNMGVPVAFRDDKVKSGGLFNSTVDDCVVMFHPEHEWDYFKFCIRVKHQGSYAFVIVNDFGQSKQINKANTAEYMKQDRSGQSMSYKVGSLIGQGLRTLVKSTKKLEEENMYYQCILDIFDDIVS
jgi:hypothetical protein